MVNIEILAWLRVVLASEVLKVRFNRRLKVSNVLHSLIAAGNSFQSLTVAAEKLKELTQNVGPMEHA